MKKFFKVAMAVSAFAMALILAGCDGLMNQNPDEKKASGVISGKVVYQEGVDDFSGIEVFLEKLDSNGISASIVQTASTGRAAATSAYYASTVTDSDGSYKFENLPAGKYTVYATNKEEAAYRSVTIAEGQTVTVEDLKLQLKGSLSGTLSVTGGEAAGSLVGVAGTSYMAFVAEDGSFTISGIPAGTVKLCVMTNGKYQAFDTEYTVDGKTVAKAGTINVNIESEGSDSGLTYITAYPTERGIYFSGTIPSNITYTDTSSANSFADANCSIVVRESQSGITMHKDWSRNADRYDSWNLTYPFVETDKKYNFTVEVSWKNYIFYSEKIEITATGGLGEYRIENIEDYDVELTEDRVIQRTGKPEFTNNNNVKIKRQGISYCLYAYMEKPEGFWDGTWVEGRTLYGDYDTYPLNDIGYIRGWGIENPDILLSGHWYGIMAKTVLEIAGYSDDDNIFFEMNDEKYAFGEWDGKKQNILVVYGYQLYSSADTMSNTKDFVITGENGEKAEVLGLPGTKHGDYQYSEVYDILETRYEPVTLPEVRITDDDSGIAFRFEKWSTTYPTSVWSYSDIVEIDGENYLVQYVYAIFVPMASFNVTLMMNDGTQAVYAARRISTEKNTDYDSWPNWNLLNYVLNGIQEPVRDGYKFLGWYTDKECTKKVNSGSEIWEDTTFYAGWAKSSGSNTGDTSDPEIDNSGDDTPEVLEDKVVYDAGETVATDGYSGKIELSEEVDLTGYKFLKIEFSTDNKDTAKRITIQAMDSSWNQVGIIQDTGISDTDIVAYTDFGTNYMQDTDYDGVGDTAGKSNNLSFVQIYAQNTSSWSTEDGIKVTIKQITATNSK